MSASLLGEQKTPACARVGPSAAQEQKLVHQLHPDQTKQDHDHWNGDPKQSVEGHHRTPPFSASDCLAVSLSESDVLPGFSLGDDSADA